MSRRADDAYAQAQQQGLVGHWLVASSGRRPRTPPPTVKRHEYVGDGVYDQGGNDRCTECKLPRDLGRGKAAHAPIQLPPDAQALSARILGEHEERPTP